MPAAPRRRVVRVIKAGACLTKNIGVSAYEAAIKRRDDDEGRFGDGHQSCQRAGFDCLEIWSGKAQDLSSINTTYDLKRMFHENSIEPYSINSIEHITFRDDEGRARLRQNARDLPPSQPRSIVLM